MRINQNKSRLKEYIISAFLKKEDIDINRIHDLIGVSESLSVNELEAISAKCRKTAEIKIFENELIGILLRKEELDLNKLSEIIPSSALFSQIELEKAIWRSRETVRIEYGIDYAPVKGRGGVIRPAIVEQIINRSNRGRKAGIRKLERSVQRTKLAASQSSPDMKDKLERLAAQRAEQTAIAKYKGSKFENLLDQLSQKRKSQ